MKNVLYITYCDMNDLDSGSKVRPTKIYEAFLQKGYNVKLLEGIASREKKSERIKNIRKIDLWLDNNTPDYCYIESPSDPIIFKEDRNLIKKIHKMGIKIGYFYRDAYYKFGKKYIFNDSKITIKKILRFLYYKFLYRRDDKFLNRYVDVIFVPSESAKIMYKYKNTLPLPPAGEKKDYEHDEQAKDLIYVGGVSERYGILILLEAMKTVNKTKHINLNLVCREKEKANIPREYIDCKWLKIHNVSGKGLAKIYQKSKFALMPLKPDVYNNMALPIKLYEYISYGLPIVSTNLFEVEKFIEKYNVGLVSSPNPEEYASKILELYNNSKLYTTLMNNTKNALESNQWVNRIDDIDKALSK